MADGVPSGYAATSQGQHSFHRTREATLTLPELGALGELIGAIAVVVSLIYLSRQVKANTEALRTANAATVQANFVQLAGTFTTDREAGEVVLRALEGDDSLTRVERLAAHGWFFNALKAGELAHQQYRGGHLDPDLWEATLTHFRAYWETPGMRRYWADRRASFVPEFRTTVDRLLAERGVRSLERSDHFYSDHELDTTVSPNDGASAS